MLFRSISSGNKYKIFNLKGGTLIDLSGEDNRSIIGYGDNGEENQHWELEETDGGWYFKNVAHGTYLAFEGDAYDGNRLIAQEDPFVWAIFPDEQDGSVHRIYASGTNHVIDLSDHVNPHDGTPIEIWGKWEATNQVWRFEWA